MYCYRCGIEISEENKFCSSCGAEQAPASAQTQPEPAQTPYDPQQPQATPYAPPPYDPQQQYMPPPEKPKSRKWLWITLISVAGALIIATAVYFIFFRNAGPLLQLGRAFNNLGAEVEERFDNTPLKAFPMLAEVLEDGTVTVNFDYTSALLGEWLSASVDGSVKISSILETRDFALVAEVGMYGQTFDIDAYMNKERIALRLQLLGDEFYGFRYETFRDDIRVLGNQIGLSTHDMDMLSDIVDQLNEMMNAEEEVDEELLKAYTNIMTKFVTNIGVSSRRTHIESGTERISCRSVELKITKEALVTLLNDFYDLFENNETIKEQFSAFGSSSIPGVDGIYGESYEQLMRDFKRIINEFEKNYSGDIILLFYIDREDRLLRIEIIADMEYDGESAELKATLDFGRSVTDTWMLELSVVGNHSSETITVFWDYEEHSGSYRNTVHIIASDMDSITLVSDWYQSNGDFSLNYIDRWNSGKITGNFTTDDKNFRLAFDDFYPGGSGDRLKIEVLAQTGAEIGDVDFINIDKWGNALIEAIFSLIMGGVFF